MRPQFIPKSCSEDGCSEQSLARGLCQRHYDKSRYLGHPYASLQKPVQSSEERFWSHVRTSDGCWEWQAARDPNGYGRLNRRGHTYLAHRFAYTLTHGTIAAGMAVCHQCDNPPCVRPDHLFLGTMLVNVHDAIHKGRGRRGIMPGKANGNVHLTDAIVQHIRLESANGGRGRKAALAREFGVSKTLITKIVNRKAWSHI